MATITLLQVISNPNIFAPLVSGVVAAIVVLIGQYYFFQKNQNEEKYQKLYGPLVYHLLRMRLLTDNRKSLTEEIKETFNDPSYRIDELQKHGRPLVSKWIQYKEAIEKLLEEYPGYIRKEDLNLVSDFLDGCIKREITENGKNDYTTKERTEKLLVAIQAIQKKLLP